MLVNYGTELATYSSAEKSWHYNNWTSSIGNLNGKQDGAMELENNKALLDIQLKYF
jgi:hypothetical protein